MNQDKDIAASVTGGCRCGPIRYRVSGQPVYAVTCHCRDCQRYLGGAPAYQMAFRRTDITIESGEPRGFTVKGDSGRALTRQLQFGEPAQFQLLPLRHPPAGLELGGPQV